MSKTGTYYLGRVHKWGRLDNEAIISSISQPKLVHHRDYSWTFTNSVLQGNGEYIFSHLTKFSPEGEVEIVDKENNVIIPQSEPDLTIASSPFLYLPKYSAVAYLHIWNKLEQKAFLARFSELVAAYLEGMFLEIDVQAIVNMETFLVRISAYDNITKIKSKVHPPNPLFGHLWKELAEYLESRNLTELRIEEDSQSDSEIVSRLLDIIRSIISKVNLKTTHTDPLPLGDAAVLMAADGYGDSKIEGFQGSTKRITKTSDVAISFKHTTTPDPDELYSQAKAILDDIETNRYLEH